MTLNDPIKAAAVAALVAIFSVAASGADLLMQIEPQELQATLHEPVVVRVTVSNQTTDRASVDFGGDFVEAFRVTVTGPDGRRRVLPPLPLQEGIREGGQVQLAASASYTTPLILNELVSFETPGTYKIGLSLAGVGNSPAVSITILPRDARRLSAVCAELARRALEAWSRGDALFFARTLSFVIDDEAVPSLKRVAEGNDGLAHLALSGLTRIADLSAVRALQDLYANPSKDLSQGARGSLGMIRFTTRDESLKQEIDVILANTKR